MVFSAETSFISRTISSNSCSFEVMLSRYDETFAFSLLMAIPLMKAILSLSSFVFLASLSGPIADMRLLQESLWRYSSTSQRIYVESVDGSRGGCTSLTEIYESLGADKSPLYPLETPGERYLTNKLYVLDGITLEVHGTYIGGDCSYLNMKSDSDSFVYIRGHGASLDFLDAKVTSWDICPITTSILILKTGAHTLVPSPRCWLIPPKRARALPKTTWEAEKESELGPYGSCKLDSLPDLFANVKLPGEVDMAQRMTDFNSNIFSFMCDEVDTCGTDSSALAVNEQQGEFRMPCGQVNETELPPVSVAGVNRSVYKEAWQQAMDKEIEGLRQSKTFTVVDQLPQGKKAVGSRWVLNYKADKDGNIVKTEARLVAQGFMKVPGVDFFKTSAPTPAVASVKIVMAVANELDFKVYIQLEKLP